MKASELRRLLEPFGDREVVAGREGGVCVHEITHVADAEDGKKDYVVLDLAKKCIRPPGIVSGTV